MFKQECQERDIFLYDKCMFDVAYSLAKNGHAGLVDDIMPYLKKHTGFNQEAKNAILRLVNIGKVDTAYGYIYTYCFLSDTSSCGEFFVFVFCSKDSERNAPSIKSRGSNSSGKLFHQRTSTN